MSDNIWHPYTEPPDDTRSVMLRFGDNDERAVVGFCSKKYNAYAMSEQSESQFRFVHPTHWRELTEEEK